MIKVGTRLCGTVNSTVMMTVELTAEPIDVMTGGAPSAA